MAAHDLLPILQIFIPLISLSFLVLCCTTFWKAFQRARLECQERAVQAQARQQPPIFIIPAPPPNSELYGLPRYSTAELYSSPPPYNELEPKPDLSPTGPPPRYSEAIHSQDPAPSSPNT